MHNVILLMKQLVSQDASVNPDYPFYLSQEMLESFTEFGYFEPGKLVGERSVTGCSRIFYF